MKKNLNRSIWIVAGGLMTAVFAEVPQWWIDRGALCTNRPAHDFNPVNQGQVKWMCLKAYEEFQQKLPGDGNTNILNQIDAFPEGNNFRPANQGMLKAIAQPFYDRLIEENLAVESPWASSTNAPHDFALANQGQLKKLFYFDLDAFDSDGDGLPDWWENKYGFLSADDDSDNDGLTNLQEYQQGSDPLLSEFIAPASENTPVGDGSVNPPSGNLTTVLTVNGSSVSATVGAWAINNGAVYAVGRRGSLRYTVNVSFADIFRLSLRVAQQTVLSADAKTYRLRFAVDGEFIARRQVLISGDEIKFAVVDTPFLNAGEHTVEILWDNYENEIALRVEQLNIQQYPGTDSNSNGIKDWVENRLMARNTIDIAPQESRTSPVCMEGRGLFTEAIQVDGAEKVFHGANDRWFADAALNGDGSETQINVSFENSGRSLSRGVRWKKTNVLTEPLLSGLVLRKGDALRLAAALPGMVSGSAQFRVNGQDAGGCAFDSALVYRFEQDGLYTIEGSGTGLDAQGNPIGYSRTVQVRVVSAQPEIIAAQVSQWRPWTPPSEWPEGAVADWDSRVKWQTVDGEQQLRSTVQEELYGVIRLGEKGPVLAPVAVKGFNLWFMKHTYLHYDEIYEDGSFKAKTTMIMSPLVPEIWINQRCRGVIAYEDGSRVRDFTLADFNANGEVTITFYHSNPLAHSVCHYTDVYQGNVLIGRSY